MNSSGPRATYRILDYRQVIERLDQAEEFVLCRPQ
jgi:hypothetical protein